MRPPCRPWLRTTGGGWLIVAPDARCAAAVARRVGSDADVWVEIPDDTELTIRQHEIPVTLTARDWTREGEGVLAIMEPVVWWYRGRDWITETLDIDPKQLKLGPN
jgi:hypothetical protein